MTSEGASNVAAASAAVAVRIIDICTRAHRDDLATRLRPALDALDTEGITVVVAGETQRGKSTLINSLLDAPALLPAGSEHPTTVPITIVSGTPGRAAIHRPGRPPRPIGADELGPYLAASGPEPDGADCTDATIEHDHPLLMSGLRIVDTPGIGGMVAGRAMLTLAALSRAEAVLFVVDATVPLTRGELAFVVAAAERTAVIFALARIDRAAGWREILEQDRRLVADHAPQLANAPWFPVSAEMKTVVERMGLSSGDPMAERAMADSGMIELASGLRDHLVRESRAVRANNVRRVCRGVIDALAEPEARVVGITGRNGR